MSNPTDERIKILIVEYEPSIADNIQYSLESEGYYPIVCHTGKDALDGIRVHQPSLMILDVGLPDMNGFEVCSRLQSIASIPVIFLTARNTEIDRVVGLEMGGDDYVCKPFSPRELTARVRAVLRRSKGKERAMMQEEIREVICDLEVDNAKCQIRYNGNLLVLSRYEYRLLCAMASKPGRVYSRAQLMNFASDEPDAAMERTVDVHVKTLRAKMRAFREDVDAILTHRGLGYSFSEHLAILFL